MAHRLRLAALLATTAIVAPTIATADPISIGLAAATAAFSAAASGVSTGIAAGLTFSAALGAVSATAVAGAAIVGGALAGLSQVLQKKPAKLGSAPVNTAIRQSTPILPYVYGDTRVGGYARIYHASEAGSGVGKHLVTAWVLAAAEIDDVLEIYDGDTLMWSKADGVAADYVINSSADMIEVATRLGADSETIPVGMTAKLTDTLDTDGQSEFLADTAGKPYVYITFFNVNSRWRSGLPQSLWFRVKGHHVYDPRTDETKYSNNLALCAANYVARAAPVVAEYLDWAQILAATNLCSESVALPGGGTQFRYLLNGAIPSDAEPRSALVKIMSHAAGQPVWTGDRLLLMPGAYSAPVASFAKSDFVKPLTIEAETLVEEVLDGVTGSFNSRANDWNDTEIPELMLDDYDPASGDPRVLTVDLPWIDDPDRAQRVATLTLRQSRRLRKVTFGVSLSSTNAGLGPGDTISVALDTIGLDGVFEIVERSSSYNPQSPHVQITAVETGASFWSWGADEATAVPVSLSSNLPSSRSVLPPSGLTLTPQLRVEDDGATTSWVTVSWTASPDPYLSGYEVTWAQGGQSRAQSTSLNAIDLFGLDRAAAATVEVVAVNVFGVRSEPITAAAVTPGGDTTPPPVPTGVSLAPAVDGVQFMVDASSAADWAEFRLYEGADGATFGATGEVGRYAATRFRRDGMAAGVTRTFYVTAADRSGNESAPAGPYDGAPRSVTPADLLQDINDDIAQAKADAAQALIDAASASSDAAAVDTSVNTLRARYETGASRNYLRNSEGRLGPASAPSYWILTEPSSYSVQLRSSVSSFSGGEDRPITVIRPGGTADQETRLYNSGSENALDLSYISAYPNDVFEASANVGAVNCTARLQIIFRDENNAWLDSTESSWSATYEANNPSASPRLRVVGTAPANARWVNFGLQMGASTNTTTDAYALLFRPMLALTTASADPIPYVPGAAEDAAVVNESLLAEITNRQIAIADEESARTLAINSAISSITGGSTETLASIETQLYTEAEIKGIAEAHMLTELNAEVGANFASVSAFGKTMADINGNAEASYVLRADVGGGSPAFLRLTDGAVLSSAVSLSAAEVLIAGDAITLDGDTTVTGSFRVNGNTHLDNLSVGDLKLAGSAVTAPKIAVGATAYMYAEASGTDISMVHTGRTNIFFDTADVSGRIIGFVSLHVKNVNNVSNAGELRIVIGSTVIESRIVDGVGNGSAYVVWDEHPISLHLITAGDQIKIDGIESASEHDFTIDTFSFRAAILQRV